MVILRAIFAISGPDACRYLNGQLTQDVATVRPGQSAAACLTNHKGKLDAAPVFIHHLAGGGGSGERGTTVLLDAPHELREAVAARLGRYLVADDCEVADATGSIELRHALSPPAGPGDFVHVSPNRWRFGFAGGTDHLARVRPGCGSPPGGDVLTAAQAELQRVRCGLPAWGSELGPDTFPAEAGLDAFAVSFTKGCYLGQEVVSRIRSVGRVNRRLHLLTPLDALPEELPPRLPVALFPATGGGSAPPAGTLTSVAAAHGVAFALGYVHRSAPTGCLLQTGSAETMAPCRFELGPAAPLADPAPYPAS